MQDPLADMFTRIRNAHLARMRWVGIPYSGLKENITKILQEEGYIRKYDDQRRGHG